ncbi:MAG: glycogen synthase GlgA [candidate division Zixibacteria bacterium]|nr:glycogen synthase GlgA [candidate division Zixibacteria bacterium]
MKILIAGSEMSPLVKTGGLGDVLGSLPEALHKLGNDVRMFLPFYRTINKLKPRTQTIISEARLNMPAGEIEYQVELLLDKNSSIGRFLIVNDIYFGREGIYFDPATNSDYADNDERYAFFCRAILDCIQKQNWQPDIIHVNDWHTSLIPVYLKTNEKNNKFFEATRTVLTIHNMAYQGKFDKERFELLGLPDELVRAPGPLESHGQTNFLKGGISFSDKIVTVSETYAREIQNDQGCGLESLLKKRAKDLSGIINGVDYSVWNPDKDKHIFSRYRISNLSGKKVNKIELLNEIGLPVRNEVPLIGMVTRLVEQKGIGLILESAQKLFENDIQMVILGTGEKKLEHELAALSNQYPDKLKTFLKFDEVLAHKIEAASDIFLMPSMFEPCGLNQMYSFKYGTPPVVHKVGGLADTVSEFDPETGEGNGFLFDKFNSNSMLAAIKRAIKLYKEKKTWTKLMKNGMKLKFSWDESARTYHALFENLVNSDDK